MPLPDWRVFAVRRVSVRTDQHPSWVCLARLRGSPKLRPANICRHRSQHDWLTVLVSIQLDDFCTMQGLVSEFNDTRLEMQGSQSIAQTARV